MISLLGAGSGLDLNSLVSQLLTIEKQPLQRLQIEKSNYQSQISNYGVLKNQLDGLKTQLNDLKDIDKLQSYDVTISDDAQFEVQIDNDRVNPGSFDVVINELATYHKFNSAEQTSKITSLGETGTIDIQVGTESFSVNIDSSNDTLEGIRDAINVASDNAGVSASIIQTTDGVGDDEYRLVISADNSGTENTIQITDSVGNVASNLAITEQTAVKDASLTLDGYLVTRSSNVIDDVVDGITFNLLNADAATHTLKISPDLTSTQDNVKDKLQEFIDQYNEMIGTVDKLFAGSIKGDSTLRSIKSQLQNVINTPTTTTGSYTAFSDIGVQSKDSETFVSGVDSDGNDVTHVSMGKLKIDSTQLDYAIATDIDSVMRLLTDSTEGIATRMEAVVDSHIEYDGIIDIRTDGLDTRVRRVDDRIYNEEDRLVRVEEQLMKQYSQLDTLLSQLQWSSTYLSQQLDQIPTISTSKK